MRTPAHNTAGQYLTFLGVDVQGQKVETVGVFGDLLGKVRAWGRQSGVEVCQCLTLALMELALDLEEQNVA